MFGLILIIIIGQKYYKLAKKFNKKNDWMYPIIGIATYYAGAIIVGGVIMALIIELVLDSSLDSYSDAGLGLMLMPFGIVATYVLHYMLNKKWQKEVVIIKDEIQDIGKPFDRLEE